MTSSSSSLLLQGNLEKLDWFSWLTLWVCDSVLSVWLLLMMMRVMILLLLLSERLTQRLFERFYAACSDRERKGCIVHDDRDAEMMLAEGEIRSCSSDTRGGEGNKRKREYKRREEIQESKDVCLFYWLSLTFRNERVTEGRVARRLWNIQRSRRLKLKEEKEERRRKSCYSEQKIMKMLSQNMKRRATQLPLSTTSLLF